MAAACKLVDPTYMMYFIRDRPPSSVHPYIDTHLHSLHMLVLIVPDVGENIQKVGTLGAAGRHTSSNALCTTLEPADTKQMGCWVDI
jgi:hypothetical protein